jgi:peptidoglycan/LPS O-acetylase OafA/YrhL
MIRDRPDPVIQIELLRFLCAIAVMGAHYGSGFWYAPGRVPHALLNEIGYRPVDRFGFEYGWIGVQVFFVISGVMIARSAMHATRAEFLRRRLLRLAPAAWICATLTLAIVAGAGLASTELSLAWARSMLFFPIGEQIDSAYWTIGIELVFYLLVATVIGRTGGASQLESTACGLIIISMLGAAIPLLDATYDFSLPPSRASDLLLLTHGSFFAIGIMIAQCQATRTTLRRVSIIGLAAIPAAIQICNQVRVSTVEAMMVVSPTTALIIGAVAVSLIACAGRTQPVLAAIIDPAVARWLGRMTYPLYLLHMNIGAVAIAVLVANGVAAPAAIGVAACLAILAAALVTAVLEPLLASQLRLFLELRHRWPGSGVAPERAG